MKIKLTYSPQAVGDLEAIVKYHTVQVGVVSGRKIYATIRASLSKLQEFPLMGQTHPDPVLAAKGYRKLVVGSTYVCVYKVFPDQVYLYRVVNGTTDYPRLLY